jgi:succinate dehydrogenase hydrophobic anchor subunit
MSYFIEAIEYTTIMLEKIQYWNMHGFFVNNFLKIWLLGILYNAIMHKQGFGQA